MRVAVLSALAFASPAVAAVVDVPSGQVLKLHETVVVDPERRILYLGFLATALGGDYPMTYDKAATDMDVVCRDFGLALAKATNDKDTGTLIEEVVVRLMARAIPYGSSDSDAAQFVSAYDITNGECQWN